MRLSLRVSLGWVLFGPCASLSSSAVALPSAEHVIAAHVRALGGRAALGSVQSLIIRGRYSEGDFSIDAVQATMRPYYRLVGDSGKPVAGFAEGYGGSAWKYYEKPGFVPRTVGAAAASRHGLTILGPLIDYKAQGFAITVCGVEKVAGHRAYRLRVYMPDGYEEDQLIDTKTFLPVASRKVAEIHAFGEKVAPETRFSNFHRAAGVPFPFLAQDVEIATCKVLNTFKTASTEVNSKLDPAAFSPPEIKRTPPPALLECLFAERTNRQAILWSHRDFRRANTEVDTGSAIETIAYRILKTGEAETAIVLLEENARAYPKSSDAQFGLGRAHDAADDKVKAKAAFETALALGPANRRASAALKTLEGSPKA